MIDLENSTLTHPLSFIYSTEAEGRRKLGIWVAEKSSYGEKNFRHHHFSLRTGIYQGYDDISDGLKVGGLEISYKRTNSKGKNVYFVRRYENGVKIGKTDTILEDALPRIEANEKNEVRLLGGNKLEHLDPPETASERLLRENPGLTLAEIFAKVDKSLEDDTLTRDYRQEAEEKIDEPLPEAKFDEEGKAQFDFGEGEPTNPETPGMGTY